jgi:homopolymeric O-antigen transport system ATP-binding protein
MSSDDVVLRAEHLGKQYKIGERVPYRALRDVLGDAVKIRGRKKRADGHDEYVWALHDVSFEVRRGEVIGLIGANGAGKSTLLRVLSRITDPTKGQVMVRGRVGSLLEVGTGFHPELTGRENIYLNGTILGMRRAEIDQRFDDIVEFSGVSKFLDTPVKRYSSGMQVRLAFAVAAHLQPEILLVDEVLAVGDLEFQKKCLGKMGEVTQEGRTIVFVSHNLAAVRGLCPRSLVLERGRVAFDGATDLAVQRYVGSGSTRGPGMVEGAALRERLTKERIYADTPFFRCLSIAALDERREPTTSFRSDEDITIAIEYEVLRRVPNFRLLVTLGDGEQGPVLRSDSLDDPASGSLTLEPGRYRSEMVIPGGLFGEVQLVVNVSLIAEVNQVLDYAAVLQLATLFQGHNGNVRAKALLRPQLSWRTEPVGDPLAATSAAAE